MHESRISISPSKLKITGQDLRVLGGQSPPEAYEVTSQAGKDYACWDFGPRLAACAARLEKKRAELDRRLKEIGYKIDEVANAACDTDGSIKRSFDRLGQELDS